MKVLDYTGTSHLVSKTKTELAKKVDKVTGKGLSTNDYTNAEKQKVADSLTDAPSDGKQYARQDGDWEELDLDGKANIDGYYDTLSVGLADNLIDRKGNGTPQEISYRTSCGDDSIADDGNGIIQSIFGKTVVWNQLLQPSKLTSMTNYGVTITVDRTTGKITGSGVATQSGDLTFYYDSSRKTVSGHKYYLAQPKEATSSTFFIRSGFSGFWYLNTIASVNENGTYDFRVHVENGANVNFEFSPQFIDLTQMFGAGNEPTSVDDPRIEWIKQYANDHPEYNSGELISYNGSGLKTVGFNQWDEEIANGYFNAGGIWNDSATTIASKYPIPVFEGMQYYCKTKPNTYLYVTFWKEYHEAGTSGGDKIIADNRPNCANTTFTIPQGCKYIHFNCGSSYPMPYQHDICFNITWSGYRNGEYEPYWSRTLNLPISQYFPDGMKSAVNARDEMTKDKAVKRIGERAYQSGDENDTSVVTDGTTTYYPLAEPIETTITPPLDPTYKVADFGTEESIAEGKSTPFNGIIKYSDDFTRGLVNMPKNYDTTASLDALATSLSTMLTSALDGTVTITRGAYDSTNKKYAWNCSFTPNA